MKIRFLAILFYGFVCASAFAQNRQADLRLNTVVIDPGHGGKDPGTVSPDRKTYEKTVALKISKEFARKLQDTYPGMNVSLTRTDDRFIELMNRARFASNKGAQLFISVHINATAGSRSANGFSVYILGQSSNKKTDTYAFNMEVLKRENSVIELEDDATVYQEYDASPEAQIMMQLMSNAFREQSLLFAQMLNDHMTGPFRRNLGVYQGNFCVLRQASMPAVLVELGYMTNSEDLAVLRSDEKISEITDNMLEAFKEYKSVYDASVTTGTELPVRPIEEGRSAPETSEPVEEITDGVFYGTQVLASVKLLSDDDRFFKGNDVIIVKSGNIYRYILGASEKLSEAKEKFSVLKAQFGEVFLVEINGDKVMRK